MRAGPAALCPGTVLHRRTAPAHHEFEYDVSYVWLDPADPDELCGAHPLWSATRPAPARFRRRDYGAHPNGSLADEVRRDLEAVLGRRPTGAVRMLTQVRRWGWLFNPITVYVAWDADADRPAGCVLEVTNTPWKQRHRYALSLCPGEDGWWLARTDKVLHVSPFLDEGFEYRIGLRSDDSAESSERSRIDVSIDVVRPGSGDPTVSTLLTVQPEPPTRRRLGRALRGLPTLRVSAGIHAQAARLWRKRVPFVPHPDKRSAEAESEPADDHRAVRADRLLSHAERRPSISLLERATTGGSTAVLHRLLARMSSDGLAIHGRIDGCPATDHEFGPGGDLAAEVIVTDPRAYSSVLAEGSVGFGRGFIEGWWTSDDPVAVVQVIIRNMRPIDDLRNRWTSFAGPATDRLRSLRPRDSRTRNRDDIGAHYDIGNAFFELFLDETMTYSSAVFDTPDTTLADASRHKYDLLLDKLGVGAGTRLLEIGTGWGGMAVRAATRGAEVTTTTISDEQLREARKRVANEGLTDRVTLLDSDWRDLSGRYDCVVSIEMIEAVDWRDYDDYFATIERCLVPGGRAAIQAITLPDDRWERAKNTEDFIRRFVFPNGFLPSIGAIESSVGRATSMRLCEVDDLTPHYAETLRRWRTTFDDRIDEVAALGLDERFQRLWRFYLAYCEAGFLERHCGVAQIVITNPTG